MRTSTSIWILTNAQLEERNIGIMDLPEEIWLLIFKHLGTTDLRQSVRYVCQDWYRVVEDVSLYMTVTIDYRLSIHECVAVVEKYRHSISFMDIGHYHSTVLRLAENCQNLKILRMDYCRQCKSISTTRIHDLFQVCQNLIAFEIWHEIVVKGRFKKSFFVLKLTFFKEASKFFAKLISKKRRWMKDKNLKPSIRAAVVLLNRRTIYLIKRSNLSQFVKIVARETFGICGE